MSANTQSRAIQPIPYMQNRELSWLDFNKRVLDQGADDSVPLLERLNFISIFWSNLREFFMVRVGSLTDLLLVKQPIIDSKSNMTPAEQLDAIYARCHKLYPSYEQTYERLRRLLVAEGIERLDPEDLDEKSNSFLDKYMRNEVMPLLSPQIINARHPFPHLENGRLYIVVRLNDKSDKTKRGSARQDQEALDGPADLVERTGQDRRDIRGDRGAQPNHAETAEETSLHDVADDAADDVMASAHNDLDGSRKSDKVAKNLGAEGVTLGIIPLPHQCDRIVRLPGKHLRFMLLEDIIEMHAAEIFSMYKVKHTNIICVTRNADLDATEGNEEQGEDYREHMKRILKKRTRLAPVRLECQRPLSSTVEAALLERLNLKAHQVFVSSVPLDMSYTFKIPDLLSQKKRQALTQTPFVPPWPTSLDRNRSMIKQVEEDEVLLSYPYESMDPLIQLLREAANDPDVVSIEITLYRLASQSHLAEALIAAAEEGKDVTTLLELRARFDESNNIAWSQRLEQAGCHVIYGFQDLKVHAKICAITRQTENGLQIITQLGTGNYNEKTARLYTDFCFMTTDSTIGSDADRFFRNMALENTSDNYDALWVAPLQIKQNILASIDEQIALAREGKPTGLFFKTNSITDNDIIHKIVQASQEGVHCTLFVRGISCIVPGIEGYTDNVRVVSIVGRLLEHSRIYCFGPRESCRIYLSSADLMTRNMDKRIEIAWPVVNEKLHDEILGYLATCMADTAKLRELLPDTSYTPLRYFAQVGRADDKHEDKPVLFDAQEALIDEAQQHRFLATELAAAHKFTQPKHAKSKTSHTASYATAGNSPHTSDAHNVHRVMADGGHHDADARPYGEMFQPNDDDTNLEETGRANTSSDEAIHVNAVILDDAPDEDSSTPPERQIVPVDTSRGRSAGVHAAGIALGTGMLAFRALSLAGKAAARAVRGSTGRRHGNKQRTKTTEDKHKDA